MSNKGSATATATAKGLSFTGALQIAFIVLKLCKVIDWSWWLVLLPALISTGIALLMIIPVLVLMLLAIISNKKQQRSM